MVETAGKLHYDDDGTPQILALKPAVIRLFGVGLTNNTVIAFTDQIGQRGDICDKIKSAEFPVSSKNFIEYASYGGYFEMGRGMSTWEGSDFDWGLSELFLGQI